MYEEGQRRRSEHSRPAALAADATAISARPCTYCPDPGADVCVRTSSTGDGTSVHVYAHRACAARRGVIPMYSILDEPAGKGQHL